MVIYLLQFPEVVYIITSLRAYLGTRTVACEFYIEIGLKINSLNNSPCALQPMALKRKYSLTIFFLQLNSKPGSVYH